MFVLKVVGPIIVYLSYDVCYVTVSLYDNANKSVKFQGYWRNLSSTIVFNIETLIAWTLRSMHKINNQGKTRCDWKNSACAWARLVPVWNCRPGNQGNTRLSEAEWDSIPWTHFKVQRFWNYKGVDKQNRNIMFLLKLWWGPIRWSPRKLLGFTKLISQFTVKEMVLHPFSLANR